MRVTCTSQGCHMHITWMSHAHHTNITCTSHGCHMHIALMSHVHHKVHPLVQLWVQWWQVMHIHPPTSTADQLLKEEPSKGQFNQQVLVNRLQDPKTMVGTPYDKVMRCCIHPNSAHGTHTSACIPHPCHAHTHIELAHMYVYTNTPCPKSSQGTCSVVCSREQSNGPEGRWQWQRQTYPTWK